MNLANTDHQMVNSPFKWVGGKSRLRKEIVQLLPLHTCYVEPFGRCLGPVWEIAKRR